MATPAAHKVWIPFVMAAVVLYVGSPNYSSHFAAMLLVFATGRAGGKNVLAIISP